MFKSLKEIFARQNKSQSSLPSLPPHARLHNELASAFSNEARLRGEKPKEEIVRSQATAASHYWAE